MREKAKRFTIGLDLGGTNSVFGIVDSEGNIKAQTTLKTQGYDNADDYVDACMLQLNGIIDEVGGLKNITSMGIGAPNSNYLSGCIEDAANIIWAHETTVPLAQMFSDRLGGLPVKITNDANAAAIGEMTFGVAKGMKNFIVITLGTGVGSGIVCNGQLVYGCDGMAGELGHMIMRRENGRLCGCGRKGCLETYCSATGVARTVRQILQETSEPTLLRRLPLESITSYDVSVAAGKGDAVSKRIYEITGTMLGEACAEMAIFSSPEAFIFFGGMAKAGDLLLDPLKRAYDANVMPAFRGKAKFLLSTLDGAGAAVLGAASLK